MAATIDDLWSPHGGSLDLLDLAITKILSQLIGEEFQLLRVSYGDELTLHFGKLSEAKSKKLKGKMYGKYILGLRASRWRLMIGLFGPKPQIVVSHHDSQDHSPEGRPITKEELEAGEYFVKKGSRVTDIFPLMQFPAEAVGLRIDFSDGSRLLVLPQGSTVENSEIEEDDSRDLPELEDWQLQTPLGLLKVGPGLTYQFEPND